MVTLPAPFKTIRLLDLVTDQDKAHPHDGEPFDSAAFDWTPIVERTAELMTPGRPIAVDFGDRATYCFRKPWVLARPTVLRGWGVGVDCPVGSTQLWFPSSAGVVVPMLSTTDPRDGRGSYLESLTVVGGLTNVGCDGVTLLGPAILNRVAIRTFARDGIHVLGHGSTFAPPSAAGGYSVLRTRVDSCGRHGLYAYGRDAAVGEVSSLRVSDCQGVGIYDNSQVGSTFTACTTHNNRKGGYKTGNFDRVKSGIPNDPWDALATTLTDAQLAALCDYEPAGGSRLTMFVNCYAEDFMTSDVRPPAMVHGGFLQKHLRMQLGALSMDLTGALQVNGQGLKTNNGIDPDNAVFEQQGASDANGGGAVRSWGSLGASQIWREVRRTVVDAVTGKKKGTGWWAPIYAGQGVPYEYCDTNAPEAQLATGPTQGSKTRFPGGYYLGPDGARIYVVAGKAPPTTGVWTKGSRVENADPDPGEPLGWVCTKPSGTAGYPAVGEWKPYGAVGA